MARTLRGWIKEHGCCGQEGRSVWVLTGEYEGCLLPTCCMREQDHKGAHHWHVLIPGEGYQDAPAGSQVQGERH